MNGPAVVVEGLRKRFGELAALDGVDFAVPAGSVFGLLGPNGAGKTTAVRILSTILRPDDGRATVLGHDVVRAPEEVRRRIGLAGQFAAVDPNLTGRENLRMVSLLAQMPREDIASRAADLLGRFDLTDAADRPVRTYSGGMRRRLDVAASLVAHPPVLFLDEPTTGLDLSSRNALWALIRELVDEGTTVLLTTQYLEEADRLADRVAVIDIGKVIADDTPARLKSRLGSTVVEMGFTDEIVAGRAVEALQGRIADSMAVEGSSVRLTSDGGAHVLVEVLRTLDAQGIDVHDLGVREPSLDDVFLSLTGHRAEPRSPSVAPEAVR